MKKISIVMLMILSMALIFNVALFAQTAKVVAKAPTVQKAIEVPVSVVPVADKTMYDKIFSIGFVQDAIQVILLTVIPFLLTGLGMIGVKLYSLIQSYINNIQSELGKKAAQKTFDVLRGIIDRIGATERKKLEAKMADGKLDKAEFKELMTGLGNDALQECKATVGVGTMEQAKAEFANFESHMKNALESYVQEKKDNSLTTSSTQPSTTSDIIIPSTAKAA